LPSGSRHDSGRIERLDPTRSGPQRRPIAVEGFTANLGPTRQAARAVLRSALSESDETRGFTVKANRRGTADRDSLLPLPHPVRLATPPHRLSSHHSHFAEGTLVAQTLQLSAGPPAELQTPRTTTGFVVTNLSSPLCMTSRPGTQVYVCRQNTFTCAKRSSLTHLPR
jgi:hypothetical protein